MSHRHIPSDFVKSVLQNGVGRYVCQLQRITLKFCKTQAGSRGVRDFIENHLLEFTRKNPGVVVYMQPRRFHIPRVVGEYLNGEQKELILKNYTQEEVGQWVEHLRCQSGNETVRLRKTWHTDTPSIQGHWTPFTNLDSGLNVTSFPDQQLSEKQHLEPSATHRILELAKQMKVKTLSETKSTD